MFDFRSDRYNAFLMKFYSFHAYKAITGISYSIKAGYKMYHANVV